MSEKPCGAYFFAFFENFFVPILTSGGLAAVSSSFFAALYSAFGKYDVVHIHAEGPAFFCWLPKLFGKRVVVTIHGIDWQREKWQSGLGSKFIHQGEKNAAKYADEVIVLSKGVHNISSGSRYRQLWMDRVFVTATVSASILNFVLQERMSGRILCSECREESAVQGRSHTDLYNQNQATARYGPAGEC